MLSQSAAIRKIQHERQHWRVARNGNGDGQYVLGVIHGLHLAIRLLQDLGAETKERMKNNPRYLCCLFQKGQ